MIESGDFTKPAWVYVVDGYKRNWKTLWLVREPILRRVFIGYIEAVNNDMRHGMTFTLCDHFRRMQQRAIL